MKSFWDTINVARFHIIKSLRTRSFFFLCIVYMLLTGGTAWISRQMVFEFEKHAADLLKVPRTQTPGAMIDTLRKQNEFQQIIQSFLPDVELLEWAISVPILTLSHFWISLGFLPFIATVIGAELISPNIKDRSLRFEISRTGRLEIIFGRALGQIVLLIAGTLAAMLPTIIIGHFFMAEQPLGDTIWVLLSFVPKLVAWTIPFLGLGIACSMLTSMTNLARVLSLICVTASWILYLFINFGPIYTNFPLFTTVIHPLVPQNYGTYLWGPGLQWLSSGLILTAQGIFFMLCLYPFFARRNL